jgi:hypothetical protein
VQYGSQKLNFLLVSFGEFFNFPGTIASDLKTFKPLIQRFPGIRF